MASTRKFTKLEASENLENLETLEKLEMLEKLENISPEIPLRSGSSTAGPEH